MKPTLPYFSALPNYAGGKRKLLPWIQSELAAVIPQSEWPTLTFVDMFAGAGSVSLWAKLKGFGGLISNDISGRSQIVLQGLIANQHTKLRIPVIQQTEPGFVCEHFAGSVFSLRHAQALDDLRACIEATHDPIQQQLLRLLLWKRVSRFVSFGTSIGESNRPFAEALNGTRPFASLNPKRFTDGSIAGLLEPCWEGLERDVQVINQAIFPALGSVSIYQEDVFELMPRITAQVAYADPPYLSSLGYGKTNEVLDAILFGEMPSVGESEFTTRVEAISELLDLGRHIPCWILSNNDKVLTLEEFKALVQRVDPSRQVKACAKVYKHMAHVSTRENQELLIIATKRG